MKPILIRGPATCGALNVARKLCDERGGLHGRNAFSLDRAATVLDNMLHAGMGGVHPIIVPTVPFRAPHHTTSQMALQGSKVYRDDRRRYTPGEIQLAAHGVIFLDSVEEFSQVALTTILNDTRHHPEHEVLVIGFIRERPHFDSDHGWWARRTVEVEQLFLNFGGVIVRGTGPDVIMAALLDELTSTDVERARLRP